MGLWRKTTGKIRGLDASVWLYYSVVGHFYFSSIASVGRRTGPRFFWESGEMKSYWVVAVSQAVLWCFKLFMVQESGEKIHRRRIKPCEWWDNLHPKWCRISAINSRWWFLQYFLFSPRKLGQIPILTSIFFRWVGEKPPTRQLTWLDPAVWFALICEV